MRRNIRKLIAILAVLGVLVTAQLCTLAEDTNAGISGEGIANSQEQSLMNDLKTAWKGMYKETEIAKFDANSKFSSQANAATLDLSNAKISFNEDGTFNKNAGNNTWHDRGVVFNKNVDGTIKQFENRDTTVGFNDAFNNNDSLYFTFNSGTVKKPDHICVLLQYNSWDSWQRLYSEISVNNSDEVKEIRIEDLEFKTNDSENYPDTYTFKKLSDMLTSPVKDNLALKSVKVGFGYDLSLQNATISSLMGAKNAELPKNVDSLTAAELYNEATKAKIDGYENADAFVTARKALYDYLSANDQDFIASELKDSWSELIKTETVGNLRTADSTNNPANLGITFTDTSNSETGYVFNKEAYTTGEYGTRMVFNSVYPNGDDYYWFDSGLGNGAFNSAFTDNDDIYITLNTGDLTTGGKILFSLYYHGDKAKHAYIDVTEANKEIKLSVKEQFRFENLSDALTQNLENEDRELRLIKISFSQNLVTTNAKIYPLKTIKYAELPEKNDTNEVVTGKALRVKDGDYDVIPKAFVNHRNNLYNLIKGTGTLGDVNGIEEIDIRDLVHLSVVISAKDYDIENHYQLLADINKDGYVNGTDINKLREIILNN